MKLNPFGNLILIALTVSLAATGCKKNPTGVTPLPGERVGRVGDPNEGGAIPGDQNANGSGGGVTGQPVAQGNPGEYPGPEDHDMFKANTVYFDYDQATIRSGEKSKLGAIADYLKANPEKGLRVEGNCDERGTDQYNFSLGERRALAAREALIALGVDGTHVLTVSYGRSRPADTGHSDAAHAKNRRDEFVVLSK